VDLKLALQLLSLPREVCRHPDTNEPISASVGRFGPYIQHQGRYVSLKGEDDVLTIGANRAIALLAEAAVKSGERIIGDHPKDRQPVFTRRGRFGNYVQHGRIKVNLPRGTDPKSLTMDDALTLLTARASQASVARGKGGKAGGKTPRKAAAKKAGAAVH